LKLCFLFGMIAKLLQKISRKQPKVSSSGIYKTEKVHREYPVD
jgi:hypothetical protein